MLKSIVPMIAVALLAGCASGPAAPSSPVRQALARGVAFLVKSQNADGSWGTGTETRGTEVMAAVPGSHDAFRVATTALCVMALREAGEKTAHAKGLEYLVTSADEARRADPVLIYNTWAHTYALQALAIEMRHNPGDPRIGAAARSQIDRLARYQTHLGGWNYYDFRAQTQTPSMGPTSFGTAAGLVALYEAKQSGLELPPRMVELCLKRLSETRLPDGAYLYGNDYKYRPRLPANRLQGSIGRTQSCNDALWLWAHPIVGVEQVRQGLTDLFTHHAFIDMGRRRPYPHESWYQTAAYYYYFGHYYASRLIQRLPAEDQKNFAPKLVEVILPHQEEDGSWWDYAMWDYHKPYGTAFAVMTLLRVQPMLDAPQ